MKTNRKLNYAFTSLKIFLRDNKFYVLLGCAALLVGIVIGVLAARGFGEDYYKLNFIFELQSGTFAFAKTFFIALLCMLGGMALILLCGFNKWLIIPAFFIVGFFGYRLGLNLVGCMQPGTASGVACIIFYYLPLFLTAAFAFIAFICMVFTSICGARGVFASAASVKRLVLRALPLFIAFVLADIICAIIIPLLYKLFFM